MKETPTIVQAWMAAVRMRTLPIPTIQVLTGTALAYFSTGSINFLMAFYTWLVAVFVTIGTNLINDVIDDEKGGDKPTRVGFLKVIPEGLISRNTVRIAGFSAFGAAVLCGIPLGIHAGWPLFFIVILSVICGYCYTGGPYPISYLGLSELFVLMFYGFVCVSASYYVQALELSSAAVLCSLQMGLLAVLPNALNNFRDMYEDAQSNKQTLAVRFGRTFARREIASITTLPFILNLLWFFHGYPVAALLPLLLIPMAFLFLKSIYETEPGPLFNKFFGLSVMIHFLFGLLLVIGWFLG
jgi:1,4-dihydroxy-2-naphthoate octaprenyltransferase